MKEIKKLKTDKLDHRALYKINELVDFANSHQEEHEKERNEMIDRGTKHLNDIFKPIPLHKKNKSDQSECKHKKVEAIEMRDGQFGETKGYVFKCAKCKKLLLADDPQPSADMAKKISEWLVNNTHKIRNDGVYGLRYDKDFAAFLDQLIRWGR